MNINVIVVIISATITNYEMKNIPEIACTCKTLINRNGFGDCIEGDMDTRICYVVKSSTCPDLVDSVYYDDEQYSEEACNIRAIHEINSKQEITSRISSKSNETDMHSGNQSIVNEKLSFTFMMFALCTALLWI